MAKTQTRSRRLSDSVSDHSSRRRKGPPKFQHLPHATAKKLRQQWVERKKLQSKYFGKGKKRKAEQAAAASAGAGAGAAPSDPAQPDGHRPEDEEQTEDEWSESSGVTADDEGAPVEDEDVPMHDSPEGLDSSILEESEEESEEEEDPEEYRMRTPSPLSQTTLADSYQGGTSLKRDSEIPHRARPPPPHSHPKRAPSGSGRTKGVAVAEKGYQGGSELGRVDRKGSVRRPSGSSGGEDVRRLKASSSSSFAGGRAGPAGRETREQREERMERAQKEREEAARRRARAKAAYAPESLHTFRSEPLVKRGSGKAGLGAGVGKGKQGKGGGGGGGGGGKGTGKGQPDMRLRMNALLEKIKKNVGT